MVLAPRQSASYRYGPKDDFIPTLHPHTCPRNVLNIFEGLATHYKDCKETHMHDCDGLLKPMQASLFDGNEAHLKFYLKWLARPLQQIEYGRVSEVKTSKPARSVECSSSKAAREKARASFWSTSATPKAANTASRWETPTSCRGHSTSS
eukprot:COSAG04_NODE_2771_length_3604_cov_3.752354_2_plen_150_part_00